MKYLNLKVPQAGDELILHMEDYCTLSALKTILCSQYEVDFDNSLIYHVTTGRFCNEGIGIADYGIESGDDLAFLWR